ncbi:peptidase S24 [Acinetobacter sp. ME22]|uniref:S24 family peptidase n=1 Tax=Acinetobacter sp. ME22 TaxID=2904802 RepID=UPI001EDC1BC9|nr:S24 family peptidase [Acinetobacter sp. ME22]MCG2575173.1 peptidase S24 [Acinetobacter sp. ME22]
MSTLQERMSLAIKNYESITNKRFKNIDLANYSGVSRANVGLWINGPTKELEGSKLLKVAEFLKVNPLWLAGERAQMQLTNSELDNNIDLTQKITLEGRPVPVISWVAAGSFGSIETVLKDAEVDEHLPPNKDCGKNGYGLVVTGYSMSPKFEPEDRIYVNPDVQTFDLKTNDLVIVACAGDTEATFKKLIIEGGEKYLEPLNPNWPDKIIKLTEGCRLVGKVVGLYRKI